MGSEISGKLPALAKQLEALDAKSTKAAQRVEDAAQAVTSYIKTDRRTLLISFRPSAYAELKTTNLSKEKARRFAPRSQ